MKVPPSSIFLPRKFLKTLEQRGSISGWWGSVVIAAEAYEEQYPVAATHHQETPNVP